MSAQVDGAVQAELARRGHRVVAQEAAIAVPVMLWVDGERGVYAAAGDPAVGRHAAGV